MKTVLNDVNETRTCLKTMSTASRRPMRRCFVSEAESRETDRLKRHALRFTRSTPVARRGQG